MFQSPPGPDVEHLKFAEVHCRGPDHGPDHVDRLKVVEVPPLGLDHVDPFQRYLPQCGQSEGSRGTSLNVDHLKVPAVPPSSPSVDQCHKMYLIPNLSICQSCFG